MSAAGFALLDDAVSAGAASRLYTGLAGEVRCDDPARLDAAWIEVEAAQRAGRAALLLADYEWGVRLAGLPVPGGAAGALRVLLFERCEALDQAAVAAWLAAQDGAAAPRAVALRQAAPAVDAAAFAAMVGRVRHAIAEGETYQVNLTFALDAWQGGSPLSLYRRLRQRQPVRYGACIALPDGHWVLSLSPEGFVRGTGGRLTATPMKGTAPRHGDVASDLLAREQLANAKNRAENLMIVDLLRNDLGRIARVGSVAVPSLFEVEAHPTVWQMTSTITAEAAASVGFPALLRALFPCGSITGAPKRRTMQLIGQLEARPRGIYCGAIGWVDAPRDDGSLPDFALSVPIRTATLSPPTDGWRQLRLPVGAGIVYDSEAADEYAECLLKARFLTALDDGFALIETLRAEAGDIALLPEHLARLRASAGVLGVPCDVATIERDLRALATGRATDGGAHRVRLLLAADGCWRLDVAPLAPLPPGPVRIGWAAAPFDTAAWPVAHKTTLRAPYDDALARAERHGWFDALHVNARGEVTEGARSNVFARLDGVWVTPALSCGVLPGVMRGQLLADPCWAAREAVLTPDDLARADALVVCNALRGALRAVWADAPATP